ncbi:hypothetical protein MTBPR1_100047 [Candidatus Terasakiella magnetica]|uniref:Uncharacterized protein n=1 Tax=Candidatus Terasakiella magnetica TaxID=1867952 RepID=A0A1C3RDN8_9PROT|nr:hypothetical protein [Candidatus Terasakiella magnetica]SCA55406.1 hypothetical protein MTBPR1_100047 [Candidatus Terasakiella magnetica]
MTITYIQTEQGQVQADEVTKPDQRTFREAWQLNGAVIEVDMEKARTIWRDKIRQARMPELDRLDAQYMKALEAGDGTLQQSIATQKQALRDATADPAIESATTPQELEAIQPAGLSVS